MGIGFDETSMTGVMRQQIAGDLIMDGDPGYIYGFWPDPADDAARTAFIRGFAADMAPLATGGLYVNFMAAEDPGAAAARPPVYGTRAGERLAALKRRYDPENVFRLNHNIAP